jgi:hypothetical protein
MRFAKVDDGRVTDIFEGPALAELEALYPGSFFAPCEDWETVGTRYEDGAFVSPPTPPPPSLEQAKQQKRAGLYDWLTGLDQQAVGKYVSSERLDFQRKEQEARLYQISAEPVDAPYLSVEASAAGMELSALAQNVIAKADSLRHLMALISGRRKFYEGQIAAANSLPELEQISFGLN